MKIDLTWELVSTPHPDEFAFITRHDQDDLAKRTGTGNDSWPIEGTTLYKNWFLKEPGRTHPSDDTLLYGNYVNFDSKAEGGIVTFVWTKEKTTAEQNTRYRETWSDFGDHHWPAILKALELKEDPVLVYATPSISGNDQGITTAPRYYQQEEYINDVQEGSRFLLIEYFGPRQFSMARYTAPQPGRVAYQTATREGSFPECLHDDIIIPPTRTGTSQNAGGTTTSVGGSLDGQEFPRTNFRNWRPYVKKSGQKRELTGYYKYIIRVYPPRPPRRIRRNS